MKKYLLIAISLMISAPAALAQSSTPAPAYTLLAPAPEQNYTLLAPIPCIPSPDKKQLDSAGNMVTIPGVKCPGNGTTIQNQDSVTFSDYLQEAINLMIALASVAAVFMIVWGGFEYMASAIPGVKTDGLKKVQNALVGLVLILASYLILRTIDPRFVAVPATLVPSLPCPGQPTLKIDDQNCKAADSSVMSELNRLQNEVAQLAQKSQLLGTDLNKVKNDLTQNQSKLNSINQQLNNTSLTPDQRQQLLLQQSQVQDQIANDQSQVTSTHASIDFNSAISEAVNREQNNQFNPAQKIQELNATFSALETDRDLYSSQMVKAGQDATVINNDANYAEGRVNLMIADQMIASLSKSASSGGFGGANYSYFVATPDGSTGPGSVKPGYEYFSSAAQAKNYIQQQINKSSTDLSSMGAANSAQMQSQVQTTQTALNNYSF